MRGRALARTGAAARAAARRARGRAIEFRNVGFHYPDEPGRATRWVLRNISFTVACGRDARRRRRDGERQERADGSHPATLRSAGRRDSDRRRADSGARHRVAAPRNRLRAAGKLSVQRYDRKQPVVCRHDRRRDGRWAAEWRSSPRRSKPSLAGTTRCSASAGSTCRAARNSAPRWRARWRGGRRIVLLDDALSAVDTHTEAEILRSLREALSRTHGAHRVAPRERDPRREHGSSCWTRDASSSRARTRTCSRRAADTGRCSVGSSSRSRSRRAGSTVEATGTERTELADADTEDTINA